MSVSAPSVEPLNGRPLEVAPRPGGAPPAVAAPTEGRFAKSSFANYVQAAASWLTLIAAAVTLVYVYRQAEREENRRIMEVMARAGSMDVDIDATFSARPERRELFFRDGDGERLKAYLLEDGGKHRQVREMEVNAICDRYGTMFDYVYQLEHTLTMTEEQRQFFKGWDEYFKTQYWRSYLLRVYFDRTYSLWGARLQHHITLAKNADDEVKKRAKRLEAGIPLPGESPQP